MFFRQCNFLHITTSGRHESSAILEFDSNDVYRRRLGAGKNQNRFTVPKQHSGGRDRLSAFQKETYKSQEQAT